MIVAAGLVAAFEAKVFTPSHPTPGLVDLPLAQARAAVAKVHMNLKQAAPVKSITVAPARSCPRARSRGVARRRARPSPSCCPAARPTSACRRSPA